MRHPILAALYLMFTLQTVCAQALDHDAGEILRDAAFRGDIETVESMLTKAQALYEAGEIPADQLRILNTPFAYTHPRMVAFIRKWRAEKPDSPYAKIAEVWHLHRKSTAIRGDGYARQVYPKARRQFAILQHAAWDMAEEVYRDHPRMIHASDALLRLANGTHNHRKAMHALHATMKVDPNRGTLRRGLDMMLPGWGWKWKHVVRLCDQYAALVENPDPLPELTCKVQKARWFDADSLDWMHREIVDSDLTHLDHLRIGRTIYAVSTRDEAQRLRQHLVDGYGDDAYWSYFDSVHAQRYGLELVYGDLSQQKHDAFKERLQYDPYNLIYLKTMLKPVSETRVNDQGKVRVQVVQQPSLDESLEYARRRVVASPYNPEFWKRLTVATHRADPTARISTTRAYRINAVVYANHSADALYAFMQNQLGYRDALLMIERNEAPGAVVEAFGGMYMEGDVICPFIRAARLFKRACESEGGKACQNTRNVDAAVIAISDEAARRGACQSERSDHVDDLAFTPFPVETLDALQRDIPQNGG